MSGIRVIETYFGLVRVPVNEYTQGLFDYESMDGRTTKAKELKVLAAQYESAIMTLNRIAWVLGSTTIKDVLPND